MTRLILLLLLVFGVGGCTVERSGQDVQDAPPETTYQVDSVIVPRPIGTPSPGQTGMGPRLLPVDEADEAPGFFTYRRRFIEAVSRRDTSALYAMTSEEVQLDVGGIRGRAEFREMWSPSREDSEIWAILGRVLGGGGLYEEGPFDLGGETAAARFTAPYTFAAFPGDEYDPFQHGVIVDEGVPVREEPNAEAATVDTLSYAIVRVPSFSPPEEEWTRVELPRRRSGYVRTASIVSPIDYRAVFHRIDGRWAMTAFVSGD